MNVIDYSRRRGAIVHLLPKVYALLKADRAGLGNVILWTQAIKKSLIDPKCKWLFALEGANDVKGILFYRLGDDGRSVYINELIAAKGSHGVVESLLLKLERDDELKALGTFYIGRNLKKAASEEMLEAVGLQDESIYDEKGYQPLDGLAEAIKELKLRYLR